jgi:Hsp70 protein
MARPPAYAAIDFGTTQTTAAVWVGGSEPRLLALNGRYTTMPSAVFHDGRDELLIGAPALRALRADPLRGERTPKRKLRHGSSFVSFGDTQLAMVDVIGQVIGHVYRQIVDELEREPDAVCLTRPVTWRDGGKPEQALRAAAVLGRIHCPIEMVSEAEAAARHLGLALKDGESCVVYDLGGGTCDIAVMEMAGKRLELRAEDEDEIGGETFDALLKGEMLARLREHDSRAVERLGVIVDEPWADREGRDDVLEWRRCSANLGENVRKVKERLSRQQTAALLVPKPVSWESEVTRDRLTELVARDLEASAETARGCVERAGTEPTVVYLAGAASMMPAVKDAVGSAVGIQPVLPRNPKGAIVLGGLRVIAGPLVKAEGARERVRRRAEREKAKAKEAAAREREAKKESKRAAREEAKRLKAAEPARARQRAAIEALDLGKRLSREKLASMLELGETYSFIARCVPPGSWFRNGLLMLTDRRLVWVRETISSMPEPTEVPLEAITYVRATGGGTVRIATGSGVHELTVGDDAIGRIARAARVPIA